MAKISVNNLAEAIYESLKEKEGASFDNTINDIVLLLKERHLLGKKDMILERLQKIIDDDGKIVRAKISSKNKIIDKDIKEIEEFIKKKYKAKEVVIEQSENKKLLGGIKIEIGDEILDMTLENKLHQLQNYLITN
jgi:F-type H+-transporting ATPase subunit delta